MSAAADTDATWNEMVATRTQNHGRTTAAIAEEFIIFVTIVLMPSQASVAFKAAVGYVDQLIRDTRDFNPAPVADTNKKQSIVLELF